MLNKVKNHLEQAFELSRNFGLAFGIYYALEKILPSYFANYFMKKRMVRNKCYLKKYKPYLLNIKDSSLLTNDRKIIWVYWAQGFENAPDIVKLCAESLKVNIKGCDLRFLDRDTMNEYIVLPKIIVDKFERGIISQVEFSDIFRCELLNQYGGLWLDSTVFLSDFDNQIFKLPFWTVKREYDKSIYSISYYRWNTAILHGNHNIFGYLSFLFNKYWEEHNYLLDYFLLDYFIDLVYETFPECKEMIDGVEINNAQEFDLQQIMNLQYETDLIDKIFSKGYVHKLQRRNELKKETQDGKMTVYGYLCDKYKI